MRAGNGCRVLLRAQQCGLCSSQTMVLHVVKSYSELQLSKRLILRRAGTSSPFHIKLRHFINLKNPKYHIIEL